MLFGYHVLVKSELDVGEVAHVQLVDSFFGLLGRSAVEELAVVSQTDYIDDGVHVWGGGKVESGSDVFPVVLLCGLLVFPVEILVLLVFPEH